MPAILLTLIWLILAIHMIFLWRTRKKHIRYGCFLLVSSLMLLHALALIIDSNDPMQLLLLPAYVMLFFGIPPFGNHIIRLISAARLRRTRRRHRNQR